MNELAEYYFAHEELFVIPIEELSSQGMTRRFQELLRERLRVEPAWIDLFNAAFVTYWERATELAGQAPAYWFPPRLQHVCVVVDAARVRPYFQPFNKGSWLLYATDFDPSTSNREFAAYQFLHVERMGLLQEVTQAVVRNLSYWLQRSDAEIDQFRAACRQTTRPDAPAFRALDTAMPWIRRLYHESLKPPVLVSIDPFVQLPHTGVLMPRSLQPDLDALVRCWTTAAQEARQAFYATYARRGRERSGDLCAWLKEQRPEVLVTGQQRRVLWDPREPERIGAVRAVLRGIGESAAESIRADLEVIDAHTRRFLSSLRHPEDLPLPHVQMAQGGLSYLDATRRIIAYNLREPGMERLQVPAPPYERWMLGARTIHEWGHLAADAGWVPLAPERRGEYARATSELALLFEEIYRTAPVAARALTASDMDRLTQGGVAVGKALARITLARLPDYQANLLARSYLSREELDTYIRNNVYSLALESASVAVFRRLARYAYEYQYLRFSRIADPRRYFTDSTWFSDEYLHRGLLSETQLDRLLATVGRLVDCYAVDWTRFTPEFAARNDGGGTG